MCIRDRYTLYQEQGFQSLISPRPDCQRSRGAGHIASAFSSLCRGARGHGHVGRCGGARAG
eukprot:2515891-Rhodomonas_salina.1